MEAHVVRAGVFARLEDDPEALGAVVEDLPLLVYQADVQGRLEYANRTAYEMLGYTSADFERGINVLDLVHGEDRARAAENYAAVLARDQLRQSEYRVRRADGDFFHALVLSRRVVRDGKAVALRGVLVDISQRKATEEALAESEAKYRAIVEASDALIYICSKDYVVEFANQRMSQRSGEDPVGKRCWVALHNRTEMCPWCVNERVMRGETVHWEVQSPKDQRWFSVVNTPIHHADGSVSKMSMIHDVTEKKRLEEETAKTDKLESLGLMAGGIAHDFNNILMGILGNLSLLRMDLLEAGHAQFHLLDEAVRASRRAKDLTHQLLTFAKGGSPVKQVTSLGPVVREAVVFASRGRACRLDLQVPDDLWPAEVDVGQVARVLHNLVINAAQAMPDGGTLAVRAQNVDLPKDSAVPLPGGPYVRLTLQDTGPGIPPDILGRVFDPYFTTKPGGTGLGLTVAYAVTKKHGGHIDVESDAGRGTTFTIHLPALTSLPAPLPSPATSIPGTGRGRVLVMDDEEVIRDVVSLTLTRAGYDVTLAPDGEDAVRAYTAALAAGQPFDLAILDVTVPGAQGGCEAMQRLRALHGDVRALISSGYSTDPVLAEYVAHGFAGVLPKPYTMEELLAAVSRALP
jgi:PAS domain S-box-containing protein